ncbi:MAG: hypothetical protein LBT61_02440 [Prevotellaceae bacterium]|jgi:uncharacterized protein (TIGR02145 family)|nr:hypothetical protein [Prevotellaceae bacterium]
MKTKIFIALLLCPIVLWAQNGVTVSNLMVNAGTVTFNVSWNKNAMPVAIWSDTVWVFVDYNDAGVMKRLPVIDAGASAGTVTKIPNNDKGVWVAGNARSAGSFSATIRLLTATANIAGACAYASNYPPVGEYISGTEISFTGTPMYDILLANSSGESTTVKSGDTFLLPCDYTLTSFSDATGAPGIMKCTTPGATVNFTAFNPCPAAPNGSTWTLRDERAGGNNNSYTVKLMADGRIWMVQDLKFGSCGTGTSTWRYDNSAAAVTTPPTVYADAATTYVGHCSSATNTATPPEMGYLYSWAGALNKSGAYYGGSDVGCSGTSTGTSCQGVCPSGWSIPTSDEFISLNSAMAPANSAEQVGNFGYKKTTIDNDPKHWHGIYAAWVNSSGTLSGQNPMAGYWSSTYSNAYGGKNLNCYETYCLTANNYGNGDHAGIMVRCVRNY